MVWLSRKYGIQPTHRYPKVKHRPDEDSGDSLSPVSNGFNGSVPGEGARASPAGRQSDRHHEDNAGLFAPTAPPMIAGTRNSE